MSVNGHPCTCMYTHPCPLARAQPPFLAQLYTCDPSLLESFCLCTYICDPVCIPASLWMPATCAGAGHRLAVVDVPAPGVVMHTCHVCARLFNLTPMPIKGLLGISAVLQCHRVAASSSSSLLTLPCLSLLLFINDGAPCVASYALAVDIEGSTCLSKGRPKSPSRHPPPPHVA